MYNKIFQQKKENDKTRKNKEKHLLRNKKYCGNENNEKNDLQLLSSSIANIPTKKQRTPNDEELLEEEKFDLIKNDKDKELNDRKGDENGNFNKMVEKENEPEAAMEATILGKIYYAMGN